MKWIGLAFLSACPMLALFYVLQQKKIYLNALTQLQILIDYVREEVRYAGREKGEIFKNAEHLPLSDTAICSLFYLNGQPFILSAEEKEKTALKQRDLQLLADFYNLLGSSDRTGTLKHCQYYGFLVQKQYQLVATEYAQKKKLYIALFLALSAFIFILLC